MSLGGEEERDVLFGGSERSWETGCGGHLDKTMSGVEWLVECSLPLSTRSDALSLAPPINKSLPLPVLRFRPIFRGDSNASCTIPFEIFLFPSWAV